MLRFQRSAHRCGCRGSSASMQCRERHHDDAFVDARDPRSAVRRFLDLVSLHSFEDALET